MRQLVACLTVTLAGLGSTAVAQTRADSAALVTTAKDYIEGWYQGDAERMARALHPELVKRIHGKDPTTGRYQVDNQGASRLILGTARGGGTKTPKEKQRSEVTILDVFRNAAVVRVDADAWVDYLQLVREGDRWLILNVLWELRSS
ncbi:MAG: nuclear transport factor 2 family protein [Gemmatimonadales bacterium]